MKKIKVGFRKINNKGMAPSYSHSGKDGDLAADLYACKGLILNPHKVSLIKTGICVHFPDNMGAIIESRSSLAQKGIFVVGGVIDSGYRGEIIVMLANISNQKYPIKAGDRIAQLRLIYRVEGEFYEKKSLPHSRRGRKGLGSTGR